MNDRPSLWSDVLTFGKWLSVFIGGTLILAWFSATFVTSPEASFAFFVAMIVAAFVVYHYRHTLLEAIHD